MGFVGKQIGGLGKTLSGGQGDFYQPSYKDDAYKQSQMEATTAGQGRYGTNYMADLAEGKTSDQALANMWAGLKGLGGDQGGAGERAAISDPIMGSIIAQQQLQQGPLTSALYGGAGGSELSRALADVQKTRDPGYYSLNADDQTSYGQQSGNLARMFGQGEQDLAQSLANRGLGGAASGVAGQQFSGLQGNKMEQFAGLQRQIADQAMQRQMQQSQMLRNYAQTMAGQQASDIGAQYGRQSGGVEATRDQLQQMTKNEMSQNQMQNADAQASMADKRAAYAPGFGEMLGAGLNQSGQMIGSAPGTFAQSFAGGAGSALSGGMGGGSKFSGDGLPSAGAASKMTGAPSKPMTASQINQNAGSVPNYNYTA